jgi:CDP-6-deoxy-D-xylo-4-hexulose-3-dehydrase
MVPFAFVLIFPTPETRAAASAKLWRANIEHRMVTGGCFTEHPAAQRYLWCAPEGVENAKRVHHCGLFVGNHAVDLSAQIARMREVLDEE